MACCELSYPKIIVKTKCEFNSSEPFGVLIALSQERISSFGFFVDLAQAVLCAEFHSGMLNLPVVLEH